MNRDLVAGKVMIDKEAAALVHGELLHQRGAHAHRHRPDDLAASRLRIQDASGRADRQHPAYPDFRGGGINPNFHKVRSEGRLLVRF